MDSFIWDVGRCVLNNGGWAADHDKILNGELGKLIRFQPAIEAVYLHFYLRNGVLKPFLTAFFRPSYDLATFTKYNSTLPIFHLDNHVERFTKN